MPLKILLIEDNPTIAKQIVEFLSAHKWQVDHAYNGHLGIELATNHIFDVVLLDLNLPDIDGLKVCAEIKSKAQIVPPVLMLTARDRFSDKSAGFEIGADDYLTKPFDLRELALRCKALKRRPSLHKAKVIVLDELEINVTTRVATRAGQRLELTIIGFDILRLLAEQYPKAVPRTLISHTIWSDSPPDSDALKSHIYALRQALDKPFSYPMLKTIKQLGYQLEVAL